MRELFREFAAAALRLKDERRRDTALAWHVVAIYIGAQTKDGMKLKALKHYLGDDEPERPQTANEIKRALKTLSAIHGIPLRKVAKTA